MKSFESQIINDRKQYAYIMVINNKIAGTIAQKWWSTEDTMKSKASAMATTARAFKKTAAILVYEHGFDEQGYSCWRLCHSCELHDVYDLKEYYSSHSLPEMYSA